MLTDRFRSLLEEFHRKRWFPDAYPDPFGEFTDFVSEGRVSDLLEAWKREKRGAYLDVARYILPLLANLQLQEVGIDYRRALSAPISDGVTIDFIFYHIRNSPPEKASQAWKDLHQWSLQWESALYEWARASIEFESRHNEVFTLLAGRLQMPAVNEEILRTSRDLFEWQLQSRTKAKDHRQLLQYFQLETWKDIADWNDLPALARSVAETCDFPRMPKLRPAANPAVQFVFPVQPPGRLILEHGVATNPYDALRFLIEFGKGCFFAGMNPELPIEQRICGDPSVSLFWGYLVASLLADPEGVKTFTGSKAETMPEDTRLILQCWYRHELSLSLFRKQASGFKNLQDLYASLRELAFPLEPPSFLYLYDLCHSSESEVRWIALHRAQNMIKHLRSKHGYKWFSDKKWTNRVREYWWEGHRMSTSEILADQQIPDSSDYPF